MPITTLAICDHCKAQKGSCNRWFLVRVLGECLTIRGYPAQLLPEEGSFIFCGESCVARFISKQLSTWTGGQE